MNGSKDTYIQIFHLYICQSNKYFWQTFRGFFGIFQQNFECVVYKNVWEMI